MRKEEWFNMITRITKANADKYRALFAEAVEALQTHDATGAPNLSSPVISVKERYEEVALTADEFQPGYHYIKTGTNTYALTALNAVFKPAQTYAVRFEDGETITTLEEYFSHIEELTAIDRKFTILPLESEEEFFEIDANSREIKIPQAFKNHGVAVQGDEVAEILYFKIDRFFDMDDLATKSVFIQWKAPADPSDKNAVRKEGVSVPWHTDASIKPGYVIIGWPLASEITKYPGKLDFSVRFYTQNEDRRINYSLSTLTATVDIKEGLNYDLDLMGADSSARVDASSLILGRLTNTSKDDGTSPMPQQPEFVDQVIMNALGGYEESIDESGKTIYEVYLTNKETGAEADATYRSQAISVDSGVITYTWFKKDDAGRLLGFDDIKSQIVFVPVDDTVYNPNKVYYVETEVAGVYKPFNFPEHNFSTLEEAKDAGFKLFERFSDATINHSGTNIRGTYQVRANNRLGRRTAQEFSIVAYVSEPEAPQIISIFDPNQVFGVDGNGKLTNLTLMGQANTDAHAYSTYVYKKKSLVNDAETVVADSKDSSYVIKPQAYVEGSPEAECGDGYYWLEVKSLLNGMTKTVVGEKVRVTHPASPVAITNSTEGMVEGGNYSIGTPIGVSIDFHEAEALRREDDKDTVQYNWYRYGGSNDVNELATDLDKAARGVYVVREKDILVKGNGNSSITLANTADNESGYYFCEVVNYYNGSVARTCSKFFNVIDISNN